MAALIGAALKYTPPGRWLMLSGSNPLAALYAGFPRTGVVTATYALSGTLSGPVGRHHRRPQRKRYGITAPRTC